MTAIIVVVLVIGIVGFVTMTRLITRTLSRGSDRTAESMYDNYGARTHWWRRNQRG